MSYIDVTKIEKLEKQVEKLEENKTEAEEFNALLAGQMLERNKKIKELKILLSSLAYGEAICSPEIMNERIKQVLL